MRLPGRNKWAKATVRRVNNMKNTIKAALALAAASSVLASRVYASGFEQNLVESALAANVDPVKLAAADPAEPPAAQSGGDDNVRYIEQVLVTAQRRQEVLQDVPISITAVSGKDLESSSLSGVADA